MKEVEIVKRIKDYLKTVDGCFSWKEHGGQFGTAGIPDLIICYKGRFVAFEVKTATGKLTVLQAITLRQIEKAGGIAKVVRSVDEVRTVIENIEG
jgi:penicillin-binding protein-related factor A (putative recombinase)